MIVFNLYAIPVVVVAALMGWGASALFGLEGATESLGYATSATVVGAAAELVGLKGRLFWLPVWLIGLATGTYSAWDLWGWGGLVGGLALVVVGVVALVFLGKASTRKAMREAPDHYEPARRALAEGDLEGFWDTMLDAYVPPASGPVPAEFVTHSLATLDLLLSGREPLRLGPGAVEVIEAARGIFAQMRDGGEAPSAFSLRGGILAEVSNLIAEHGAYTPSDGVRRDLEELGGSSAAT
ncbi:MAG TPA: hypothetical protein RMH99_07015 [Sandaracinaceae bacterium LLY-WYZ-13_1]|nr:hypothetical protein [Sandaracinaceae bacterium LLY-WYZ-13_1]